eukprot:322408_1
MSSQEPPPNDFANLLILCILMFILTFFIGYLPMIFQLSADKLESISIFGAGFLLGTAFIVIVPEGLSVLMETSGILQANHHETVNNNINLLHNHNVEEEIYKQLNEDIDIEHIDENININVLEDNNNDITRRMLLHNHDNNHNNHHNDNDINNDHSNDNSDDNHHNQDHTDEHHHTHTHDPIVHSVFRKMGCLICFGFIFMMGVEKFSAHSHPHSHSYHHKDRDTESMELIEKDDHHKHGSRGKHEHSNDNIASFMIGLLTHSAIDGIALGAVSNEGNAHSLSLLVFFALMAHKGPAAISMSAFLKRKLKNSQNIKKSIIKQLILFSCAAPICSILTYFILSFIAYIFVNNDMDEETKNSSQMLGYCLLFSGGTFLYVVTLHIIPEIKEWRNDKKENEIDEHDSHNQHGSLSWLDLLILTIGCVVPSLFEHSH